MEIKKQLTTCPKEKPKDESKLGFGHIFTDHMLVMPYDEGQGWHDPVIMPYGDITLSPSAMCLHYGQTVFEGLKAYRRADGGVQLFRPDENFKRLNRSNERLVIPELPEELGSLQAVRVYQNTVYLLGVRQNAAQQSESVLYCVSEDAESAEPVFTPLYPNSNASDFVGLTDFDVLSDGTICGLLCENADAVPYEDPTFNPDDFDWESYYENYATQYQLVWYDKNGVICKKLGLSTLLDLDETSRQTMAFTGVRSDASDHIYLTATIDESDCLMALDGNGNLCPVQGNHKNMLSLESDYQWIRCSSDGMLLLECDAEDVQHLSHVVVTDGALWKTQTAVPERMTADTMLAESENDDFVYGIWNAYGLFRMSAKNALPELLYRWSDTHVDFSKLERVMMLPEEEVLLSAYTAQGNLSLELLEPDMKNKESDSTEHVEEETTSETVPVATPVS